MPRSPRIEPLPETSGFKQRGFVLSGALRHSGEVAVIEAIVVAKPIPCGEISTTTNAACRAAGVWECMQCSRRYCGGHAARTRRDIETAVLGSVYVERRVPRCTNDGCEGFLRLVGAQVQQ